MRFFSAIAVLLALLLAGFPAFAGKGDVCRTPDGFVFGAHSGNGMGGTGIKSSERKGMGGTGSKLAERNGMGGTGITGDIGVYGRITAFGSICVNGMEIEYRKSTPVNNEGSKSSTKDLKVGQIVAVRAYQEKNGEFRARRISIDKIVSGRVTRINLRRGELTVMKETVLAGAKVRDQLKALREGDYVSVSGLRRADGVIVAGHIEKTSETKSARQQSPASLFGPGVRHFSLQGYVRSSDRSGRIKMADGTVIHMSKEGKSRPRANDRVIIFGVISPDGQFTAETVIPEIRTFLPVLELSLLNGQDGLLGPDGLRLPLLSPPGGQGLALPSIPGLPPAEVPTVDVPPVDLPGLPPVDVPALPPIEVPTIPAPPIIPDLPILPGH